MLFRRLVCSVLFFTFGLTFVIPSAVYSQNISSPSADILSLTPTFHPVMIQGMRLHPENPLQFDFIVDTGDASVDVNGLQFKEETTKLIKYFLASLTVPEKEMWVNLSPYEKNRIIANGLGQTELGRDMLSQDYILKQLTSSLIYPDSTTGKVFWKKVYAKTQEIFGRTDIPVDTFNKVWIVPDKAVVYEHGNTVYIAESHLKVMLESDYMAMAHGIKTGGGEGTQGLSQQIVRDIVLPELEKEVNTGKNFANLRQIYNAMILAVWFKINLQKSLLGQVYADKNKTSGVDAADKTFREKIYQQYIRSFKKGVYNYIREENDPTTGDVIPRKYFSGGLVGVDAAMLKVETGPMPKAVLDRAIGTRVEVDSAMQGVLPNSTVENILSIIKSLARGSLLSDENRGILTKNLNPVVMQRIDAVLKEHAGRESLLRITHNQILSFIKLAGLNTGPPADQVSAVFEVLTDYLQHVLSQILLSVQEQKILESTIQAYRFGYLNEGAIYTNESVLDELLDSPTQDIEKRFNNVSDTFPNDIQNATLHFIGQGFNCFVFATPDGRNIIKYVKTPSLLASDIKPEDPRFPQQSWALDYGVDHQGQLHPEVWQAIELFETYGEMGLQGKIYIADKAYNLLNDDEKERLKRYENIGIVQRIRNSIEITPVYPPGSQIFDQQKVVKISISVMLAYPRIVPLKDKFIEALKAGRIEEAAKWMDASFSFIEELWEKGIFQRDASFFNIGIQTLEDGEEQLVILDTHNWPTDFSSGLPIGATEQTLRDNLNNTKENSSWALDQIEEDFHQQDSEIAIRLRSHFEQKSKEILTFENFKKHWKSFSSNIVSVSQKNIFYHHPLFKKFLEVARGEYDADLKEQRLEVQDSVNLRAGIKNDGHERLLVVFNPSDAYSNDGKEWGRIQIGQAVDIHKDTTYFLNDLLTGEVYIRTGAQLANGFSVGLAPYRMHLFTIEEKHGYLPRNVRSFADVIANITVTPHVLPGFPDSMILQLRNDFSPHLLTAYLEFKGKEGIIEKHLFKLIPDNNGNFVLGQTVFFPEPGSYPFEITLHVNGKILKYKGIQRVEIPNTAEKWQQGPLIIPVDDHLFLGNAAASARPELLAEKGIKAVANASEERDLSPIYYENSQHIEYRQFGSTDMSYNIIPERVLWEGAKWMHQSISSGKSVFVHCHAGVGRGSSLMIAYLFLFKYPEKSFDDVVDMVREKAVEVGHFIYPHLGLAETLEKLREEKRNEIESSLGHSYPLTVQMGKVHSISFAGKFREEESYNIDIASPYLIQAKVTYDGVQPPYGVFINTNLNKDGTGENVLMHYNPDNKLYEARITPQRPGEHFWLTFFALPHRNDHYNQRKWAGKNIYFEVKRSPSIPQVSGTVDAATITNPGGIDFDPAMLNLQVKRDGKGMIYQVAEDKAMRVNGFTPVIIRIKSMSSALLADSG